MVNLTLEAIVTDTDNVSNFINYIDGCMDRYFSENIVDESTKNDMISNINFTLGKYYCVIDSLSRQSSDLIQESQSDELNRQVISINKELNYFLNKYNIRA